MKTIQFLAMLCVGLAMVLAPAPRAHAAGPISFGAGNDVGASADSVWSVAVGDLNNDGYLDIASGSGSGEDKAVIAWKSDATPFSGLWAQNDVGVSNASVNSVAVGDLDNDGDLDIVSGSNSGEAFEVIAWENSSPYVGTWTRRDVGATTYDADSVALGDLDNDGDLDIVSGSGEVIAWQNDGTPFDGTVWASWLVGECTDSVWSVAVGDLDNDGDLDIASGTGQIFEDYEVIIWENNGTPFGGTWTQRDVGATPDSVLSVALGDLDNDGDLDIVSGSLSGEDYEVIVWQNDGTPFNSTWPQNDAGASADHVNSVAVGDLDNDGDLDIVSGSYKAEDYEIIAWQNDGSPFSGLWTQRNVGASTASVNSVAVGDLDNDGDLDIVSASWTVEDYEIIVWENTLTYGDLSFAPAGHNAGVSTTLVNAVAAGDLDNDGALDLVSASWSDEDYEIIAWQNDRLPFSGAWLQNDVGASMDSVESVALGDLDNDGDLDIVSGSGSLEDYEIIAWENDGTPFSGHLWTACNVGASTAVVESLALGDLDHDGNLDIVLGSGSGQVIVWQNDGTPFDSCALGWSLSQAIGSVSTATSVAMIDLDHDGDLDVVAGTGVGTGSEIVIWANDGTPFDGAWATERGVGDSTASVFSVAVGDLNHDSFPDLVSGSASGENYEVITWKNNGVPFGASWAQNDAGASDDTVHGVAVGDLDNDGHPDIVSGSYWAEDYEVIIWRNDGSPFSGLWTQYDVGASASHVFSVAVSDLDNDGDLDIISANVEGEITIWENSISRIHVVHLPIVFKNTNP